MVLDSRSLALPRTLDSFGSYKRILVLRGFLLPPSTLFSPSRFLSLPLSLSLSLKFHDFMRCFVLPVAVVIVVVIVVIIVVVFL